MSLNCDNVQDFVSLYKDDALSEKTTEQIKDHLNDCKDCKRFYKEYDGMKTSVSEPQIIINEDADYAAVAEKIRKKKTAASLLNVAGMLAIIAGTAYLCHLIFKKDSN